MGLSWQAVWTVVLGWGSRHRAHTLAEFRSTGRQWKPREGWRSLVKSRFPEDSLLVSRGRDGGADCGQGPDNSEKRVGEAGHEGRWVQEGGPSRR